MMLQFMRPTAFLAPGAVCSASKGGVTPLPTVVALWDTQVHGRASDRGDVPVEVEGSV